MIMQTNIYQQYKTQALETLTRGEIVVKLFEEAEKQINMAVFLIGRNDAVKAYNCVAKAQKIVSTLRSSLDMRYAISLQLSPIYDFVYNQLGEAIVSKDTELMKSLAGILGEFKVTFKKADMIARSNSIRGGRS